MPGRSYSSGDGYRFGFNGKETDKEYGAGGGTQDYGFRMYSPAVGKFLSVDPLFRSYPWYTPYQFAGNRPIAAIDLDGLEEFHVIRAEVDGVLKSKIEIVDWKKPKSIYYFNVVDGQRIKLSPEPEKQFRTPNEQAIGDKIEDSYRNRENDPIVDYGDYKAGNKYFSSMITETGIIEPKIEISEPFTPLQLQFRNRRAIQFLQKPLVFQIL